MHIPKICQNEYVDYFKNIRIKNLDIDTFVQFVHKSIFIKMYSCTWSKWFISSGNQHMQFIFNYIKEEAKNESMFGVLISIAF